MPRRFVPSCVLVFAALSVVTADGQQPGQPSPGPPSAPEQVTGARATPSRSGEQQQSGTAVLRGQVVAADSGAPLRRVHVRAFSQDGRSGGAASTDARGNFEIGDLPAGRYSLSASKAGYVTMQFGQRRADQQLGGTILDVLDGQLVDKIRFSLPRGGVITGRIVDEFGEPIAGAQVSALRSRFIGTTPRLMSSGYDSTDDTGTFRIFGLVPGAYFVSATVRSLQDSMPNLNVSIAEGYAPSYYPGVPNVAEAQRVIVRAGQESASINFTLLAARLARVRGRLLTSTGEPAAGQMMVNLMPTDGPLYIGASSVPVRPEGTFQITGVAPGTYLLSARFAMPAPTPSEVAQLRITVANEDLDHVQLVLSKGAVARGSITTDEGSPLPVRPQQVRLFAFSPEPDFGGTMPSVPTVHEDWTFEIPGLIDRRLIRASLAEPGDWFLKGVYYRDQDVTDTPLEFAPNETIEGVQVVFTRKVSHLTGIVRDDDSRPALDATVIVFPGDRSKWTSNSRYMRPTRADQSGRFEVRNLPPYDDYLLIAVRDLEEGRWSDPEFLEGMREAASRASVGEGQSVVQDLRVAKVP